MRFFSEAERSFVAKEKKDESLATSWLQAKYELHGMMIQERLLYYNVIRRTKAACSLSQNRSMCKC